METLLMHRNTASDFAGGMAVFPGGRVEDDDWVGVAEGDELGAARKAAARETHEEAGLVIDADALVPYSHWQPALDMPKRFLTWFFVGYAPDAVVDVDGAEIVDHVWLRPGDAIERFHDDDLQLLPPTYVTLTSLLPFGTAEEVVAAAAGREPPRFMGAGQPGEAGMGFVFACGGALD